MLFLFCTILLRGCSTWTTCLVVQTRVDVHDVSLPYLPHALLMGLSLCLFYCLLMLLGALCYVKVRK